MSSNPEPRDGMSRSDPQFRLIALAAISAMAAAEPPGPPYPANRAESPRMLAGRWVPDDPHTIDFSRLPRVKSEHVIVSDVRAPGSSPEKPDKSAGGVNQHNYLAYHDGQFWVMWSDGPGVEDRVGQRVKYATSPDGLEWSGPLDLTPFPPGSGPDSPHYGTRSKAGKRYIARGFWQREGELLALVSLDEAAGFFGPSLELRAFRFDPVDRAWKDAGRVMNDAINNFPPRKIGTGEWLMSRRKWNYATTGVEFLVGGEKSIDDWRSYPVFGSASELKAEEPEWWALPGGALCAVFRDNRKSGYLYRSFSNDEGRTWSRPVRTNFPDATSKVCTLRLADGRYVLVSNSNPARRDPLTIAVSDDGLVFSRLFVLASGRQVDYPHVIERDGHLFVAYSGAKQSVEVLKIRIRDLDELEN